MAHMELKKYSVDYSPANYKVNESQALFAIDAGECLIGGAARVLVAFDDTNATLSLGDTDVDGVLLVTDPQNTGFEQADGALLINSIGKLYTSADTIDATYTQGDTDGTAGLCRFYIITARIE